MPVSEHSLLIYSVKATPRLLYTSDLIFKELLGLDFEITTDKETFLRWQGAKINYSNAQLNDELFICAAPILFEHGINGHTIEVKDWNGCKILFLSDKKADLPYDPLAASFYLVSCYEEYLPFKPDDFGRFKAEESLAFKKDFLITPVVNYYAGHLKSLLLQRFPHLKIKKNKFSFLLTYDIDQAFAYREKGFLRTGGSIVKSLMKGNTKAIKERADVVFNKRKDPFDTFDLQSEFHKNLSTTPYYFLLLGDYNKLDKNINWQNPVFKNLIKKLSKNNQIGIHLSIASNKKPQRVLKEINRLETITGKKITAARQHFLILKFPQTYQQLIAAGITEDYTMGFASQPGFRAGIASPFYFYNLKTEEKTTLKIYPFAVMDATLFYYLNYSADEALKQTLALIDEVKKAHGLFIFLAHNDLLNDAISKPGWQKNFEKIIEYANTPQQ